MAGDDDDKTVFGQPLPTPPKPGAPGAAAPRPAAPATPPPTNEKTVFGQPLPPAGGQGAGRVAPAAPTPAPAPAPQPQPYPQTPKQRPLNNPAPDDTWLGGALNPNPGQQPQYQPAPPPQAPYPPQQPAYAPPPQPPQQPPLYHQPAQQPLYQPGTGQRPAGSEIFPEIPQEQQQAQQAPRPRIAFQDALKGTSLGEGGSSNPLMNSAANLIILLGRLRTGLVEMQAGPLIEHVTREIDALERNALQAGVTPQDAQDAKYALSATADDIVQNMPGADRGVWLEYSMVARFFGERSSGVGFFQKMDEAMRAPGQRFHLLELMLTCLSLGFEGQYRSMPNGMVELARIRTAIYETLRRVQPRPDDDVSVRWLPVVFGGKRRRGSVPIWIVAAVSAAMIVALFATLSTLLTREGTEVRNNILSLHAGQPAITIERTEPVVQAYVAPISTQLERIRETLAAEIEAGQIEVDRNNDFIFVRVGDFLQFGSGSADLRDEFATLAGRIGATLNNEPGPIRVVGHTDSIPATGRGRYKTNESLSVARAQAVADVLAVSIEDAARINVEGKGAVDPIADNATRAGQARNRRVEIMIPRED